LAFLFGELGEQASAPAFGLQVEIGVGDPPIMGIRATPATTAKKAAKAVRSAANG
jgi:hypothetical protein